MIELTTSEHEASYYERTQHELDALLTTIEQDYLVLLDVYRMTVERGAIDEALTMVESHPIPASVAQKLSACELIFLMLGEPPIMTDLGKEVVRFIAKRRIRLSGKLSGRIEP